MTADSTNQYSFPTHLESFQAGHLCKYLLWLFDGLEYDHIEWLDVGGSVRRKPYHQDFCVFETSQRFKRHCVRHTPIKNQQLPAGVTTMRSELSAHFNYQPRSDIVCPHHISACKPACPSSKDNRVADSLLNDLMKLKNQLSVSVYIIHIDTEDKRKY